jgi:hypothetical protein
MKWALGVFALLVVISIATGGSSDTGSDAGDADQASSQSSEKEDSTAEKPAKKKASCGSKATDDCTPHLTGTKKLRVDTIDYRVTGASTSQQIGDDTYGLGEKADGTFVTVELSATNGKSESVTLTDVFKLEVGGKTYEPDNEGTVAAMGAGGEPFFLKQIGPDVTARGSVVFDLPTSAVGKKLELRVGELGFGSTHGYIRLPTS